MSAFIARPAMLMVMLALLAGALPGRAQQADPPRAGRSAAGDPVGWTPEEAGAPEEPISGPARIPEERPAFLLPDVIVEGEDLSRLGGGMRLLEMEAPAVRHQQEPLLLAPGPSAYQHRREIPFHIVFPPPASPRAWRGYLRLAPSSAPGASLAGILLPGQASRSLLWGRVDLHRNRLPESGRFVGSFGYLTRTASSHPRTRFSLGGEVARGESKVHMSGVELGSAIDTDLHVRARLEHRFGQRSRGGTVVAVEPFLLASDTRRPVPRGAGVVRDEDYDARWSGVTVGLQRAGAWDDPRALVSEAERAYGFRIAHRAVMPAYSLAGQLLRIRRTWQDPSDPAATDSAQTRARWEARVGVSARQADGRLVVGVAGGGEGDDVLLGPWVGWARRDGWWGGSWRIELAPVVTHAERSSHVGEMLTVGAGPEREPLECLHRRGLSRDGAPGVPWRARVSRRPAASAIDPHLPMQKAWPRMAARMGLAGDVAEISIGVAVARLQDPHSWRAGRDSTDEAAYHLETFKDRYVARLEWAGHWHGHPDVQLGWQYAGTWDEESGAQALAFLPRHELWIGLGREGRGWIWGLGAHLRARAPGLAERFTAWHAILGYRFLDGRLYLRADSPASETVVWMPGLGRDQLEVQLVWEQALLAARPRAR